MNLGKIIRKARMNNDLTQKKLSEIIGVHKMQIYAWEKNKYVPKAIHFLLLMKKLNLEVNDFFCKEESCQKNQEKEK